MNYLIVIRNGAENLFSAKVNAQQEDVMFSFQSRRGSAELYGMIFLDELDQTSMTLEGQELQFNCKGEE